MPKRDHSKCSDLVCVTHQIISREYVPQHRTKDCLCEELSVDISDIIHALNEEPDTSIPLLKLTGDLQILNVEVVSSRRRTPYIAVSHVSRHSAIYHKAKRAGRSGQMVLGIRMITHFINANCSN